MKRFLSIVLSLILLLGSFLPCAAAESDAASIPVTVEGSIFGGSKEPVKLDLQYSSDLLIQGDNTVYNPSIAGFSAILCADSYFRDKDLDKGTQNRVLVDGSDPSQYNHTTLLRTLGFSDVEYIESHKAGHYEVDTNDSATFLMAYTKADDHDLFLFVLRGCFSAQEWLSIFDPGADVPAYDSLTGEHPEWEQKSQMKGVSIAAQRALQFMTDFMAEHNDPDCEDVVLVTGHSRGGALANLIGAEMEKNTELKSFTYTFNTPGVDSAEEEEEYKTIFNIFEPEDMFQDPLPFGKEMIHRYGTDVAMTGEEDLLANAFLELTGREMPASLTVEEVEKYQKLFSARFADRSSLYEEKTIKETFGSEPEAKERYEVCAQMIGAESGLALGNLCTLSELTESSEGYEFTMTYCDAAWLICYSKILAYGNSAYQGVLTLFEGDAEGCAVADFLGNYGAAINAGHLLARSYLTSQLASVEKDQ